MSLKGPRLNIDWPGRGTLCILTLADPPPCDTFTQNHGRDKGGGKTEGR